MYNKQYIKTDKLINYNPLIHIITLDNIYHDIGESNLIRTP